jgi:hypothetical protein
MKRMPCSGCAQKRAARAARAAAQNSSHFVQVAPQPVEPQPQVKPLPGLSVVDPSKTASHSDSVKMRAAALADAKRNAISSVKK